LNLSAASTSSFDDNGSTFFAMARRFTSWALKGLFLASTPVLAALEVDLDDEGMFRY
jgi:hypothetical protein